MGAAQFARFTNLLLILLMVGLAVGTVYVLGSTVAIGHESRNDQLVAAGFPPMAPYWEVISSSFMERASSSARTVASLIGVTL